MCEAAALLSVRIGEWTEGIMIERVCKCETPRLRLVLWLALRTKRT